jgi:signal peptidase II
MSAPTHGRLFWGAALSALALDIVTKQLAERLLFPPHVPHPVIREYVRFTLAYNPGAAFSMSLGPYSRFIFGGFAAVALVVLWRLHRQEPKDWLKSLALGLAWGGAAGNLVDRIRSPLGVVDFIDIGAGGWRFWTFNVADSAVSVGAVLLAWVLLQEERQQHRAAHDELATPAQPPAADTPPPAAPPTDSAQPRE